MGGSPSVILPPQGPDFGGLMQGGWEVLGQADVS